MSEVRFQEAVLRITGTLLPVIALLIAIIYFALQSQHAAEATEARLAQTLRLSSLAQELKFLGADFNGWQTAYAFDISRKQIGASEETGNSRREFLVSTRKFSERLQELSTAVLTDVEKAKVQIVASTYRQFMEVDVQIIDLYRRGDAPALQAADSLVMGREIELFQRLSAALDDLDISLAQRSISAAELSKSARSEARNWLLGAGAALIVLLALMAHITVRWVMRNSLMVSQLNSMARTDPLTGIANRRAWDDLLPKVLLQAKALDYPISVAMIDIDFFKKFNDSRGHPAGDALLREAAHMLRDLVRHGDVVARYGGEEFVVLLPRSDARAACLKIDSLRASMPLGQTFSAGVAAWDGHESGESLVVRADTALYQAKEAGRNRVVIALEKIPATRG